MAWRHFYENEARIIANDYGGGEGGKVNSKKVIVCRIANQKSLTIDLKSWNNIKGNPAYSFGPCTGSSAQSVVMFDEKADDIEVSAPSAEPAYPNPTNGNMIHIPYSAPDKAMVSMRVMSLDGKAVIMQNFSINPGKQVLDLNLSGQNLQPGIYILEINSGEQVFMQKLVRQ